MHVFKIVFPRSWFRCRLLIMARKLKKPVKYTLLWIAGIAGVITLFLLLRTIGLYLLDLYTVLEHNDQQELIEYLSRGSELSGLFTVYVMSILQVVSIILPGILVQMSSALIYGWWKSFIVCWLGFVSGNAIVFVAARIMSKSLTDALHLERRGGWLIRQMNRRDPAYAVALACMVPGIPNGIIPYIAARSKLYLHQFVYAVGASCWIQIVLNCIAGHFLAHGHYIVSLIAILLQIAMLFVVTANRERILSFHKSR